jgi:hypothetical protein
MAVENTTFSHVDRSATFVERAEPIQTAVAENAKQLIIIPGRPIDLYLDTDLWNALHYSGVDPDAMVRRLAAENAYLAPGTHSFYEMAKSFASEKNDTRKCGKELFSQFRRYFQLETHPVKDNAELLAREMWALKLGKSAPEVRIDQNDRATIIRQADRLAKGEVCDLDRTMIQEQKDSASATRDRQKAFLDKRPDIAGALRSVNIDQLPSWLESAATGRDGVQILTHQIRGRFPEVPLNEVAEYALALVALPSMRYSRAVVRGSLYYNWRCANRDSVPKDVIDDIYHILNSVYCDIYATGEAKQAEYAHLLRAPNTRVATYDRSIPVDEWLESLV